MKLLLAVISVCLAIVSSLAQAPDTLWTRTFTRSNHQEAFDLEQATDGGFILAGYSFNDTDGGVYVCKTDSLGTLLWQRTLVQFGGNATSVKVIADGSILLTGVTNSEMLFVKLDPLGQLVWAHTYGGTEPDVAHDVIQMYDGGYVIVGYTYSFGSAWGDAYIVKTDSNGIEEWSLTRGGAQFDAAYAVEQTTDGGFITVGVTEVIGTGERAYYVIKFQQNGTQDWERTYRLHGPSSHNASVHQTTDGGYSIAGNSDGDFLLIRLDSFGDTLWTTTYGVPGANNRCYDHRPLENGGFVMAGYSSLGAGTMDIMIVKADNNGDIVWARTYDGGCDEMCYAVAVTHGGEYVAAGHKYCTETNTDFDVYLMKTRSDIPLPVSLASFDAIAATDGIHLSFTTASETDNARFEIWKGASADGAFVKLVDLPSQGNSSTEQRYEFTDTDVTAGRSYWYYLADVDLQGNRSEHRERMASAMALSAAVPAEYTLNAYPNPFNPTTTISFSLKEAGEVRVAVYDVSGRLVRELVHQTMNAGEHRVAFDAGDLPTGVYLVRLESAGFTRTEKVVLLK